MQAKKYPKYLNDFVNELQVKIASSLKRSGCSTKKGHFTISQQVENFLIRKFKITKRMKLSNILNNLGLDQNVIKDHLDTEPSKINKFKMRLGNKVICKYTTLGERPLNKIYTLNPSFHWEFIRDVQMNDEKKEETDTRHERLLKELNSKIQN